MTPHANEPTPRGSVGYGGEYARTNENVQIPYNEENAPHSPLLEGMRYKRTLSKFSLENTVSMVTGAARGLGLVMAQALVMSGSDVAVVDLNQQEAQIQADAMVKQFKMENKGLTKLPNVTAHYTDAMDPDSVSKTIAEVLEKHGRIDNLVTSAGFTENFDAIHYPYDRIQKCWGVNINGTYLFAVEVAKHLIARQAPGSMVMIGSMSGAVVNVPQPQAPYNAAKAAVRQLSASLAVEWAKYNIRVNCISPGYMLTNLTKQIMDENPELREKWTSLIPAGEMGNPEDLMGPVTFLLSDAARYITGIDLRVDGGYTLT